MIWIGWARRWRASRRSGAGLAAPSGQKHLAFAQQRDARARARAGARETGLRLGEPSGAGADEAKGYLRKWPFQTRPTAKGNVVERASLTDGRSGLPASGATAQSRNKIEARSRSDAERTRGRRHSKRKAAAGIGIGRGEAATRAMGRQRASIISIIIHHPPAHGLLGGARGTMHKFRDESRQKTLSVLRDGLRESRAGFRVECSGPGPGQTKKKQQQHRQLPAHRPRY